METAYQRDLKSSYMILSEEDAGDYEETYEEKMLRENEIRALLPFYTVREDGKISFWYDITGRRCLRDYVEQNRLTCELVCRIIRALFEAYEKISRYLISEENIYLTPDAVFFDPKMAGMVLSLCYFPLNKKNTAEGFRTIAEYFLETADSGEPKLMKLCGRLYEAGLSEELCSSRLLEICEQETPEEEADHPLDPLCPEPLTSSYEKASMPEEPVPDKDPKENGNPGFFESEGEEEDYEEEDPLENLMRRIARAGEAILRKFRALLPHKEEKTDLIYDPTDRLEEPTSLISPGKKECFGKLIYEGSGDEENYVLGKETFHIGSSKEGNEAVLHSAAVSRHHAKIIWREGSFYLEDLNSTNGTYVNGSMLAYRSAHRLYAMDRICFADVVYRIV